MQLCPYLDKIATISRDGWRPKVIIRSMVGSIRPLHPGIQHSGDYIDAFRHLVSNVEVIRLDEPREIVPAYQHAYERTDGKATLLIEIGDFYNDK